MTAFEFIKADGKRAADSETQGYFVRDYFDCDIETATPDELAAAYKGPDCDGIGVRWDDDEPFDASSLIIKPGVPSMHDDPAFWDREHEDAKASEKPPKS